MTIRARFGEEPRGAWTTRSMGKRKSNRFVADPNTMIGQPYVRTLPNGFQMALGRDALIALGRPKRLNWELESDLSANQTIHTVIYVKLIPTVTEDSFLVSYSREGKAG